MAWKCMRCGKVFKDIEEIDKENHSFTHKENVVEYHEVDDQGLKKSNERIIHKKIGKRGNRWYVIHHTGPDKGKPLPGEGHATREGALAQHAAIMARKHGGGKMRKQPPAKPSKAWWDKVVAEIRAGMPEYTDEQVRAVAGWRWYQHEERGKR